MNKREHALDVLDRVAEGRALCSADREPVLALIGAGYMHVNPVHIAGEVCPYRLTEAGGQVVATRRFPKRTPPPQPEEEPLPPPQTVACDNFPPIQGGAMFGKDFRDPATWPASLRPPPRNESDRA